MLVYPSVCQSAVQLSGEYLMYFLGGYLPSNRERKIGKSHWQGGGNKIMREYMDVDVEISMKPRKLCLFLLYQGQF